MIIVTFVIIVANVTFVIIVADRDLRDHRGG